MATSCLADNVWEMNSDTMRKDDDSSSSLASLWRLRHFRVSGRIKDLLSGSAKKTGFNLNLICPPLMLGKSGALHSLLCLCSNWILCFFYALTLFWLVTSKSTLRPVNTSKVNTSKKMMDFFYGRMRCLLKYLSLIHGSFMDDIWVQFPRFFWSGGKKKKKKHFIPSEWKWKARVKSVTGRRTAAHRDNLEVRWCTV